MKECLRGFDIYRWVIKYLIFCALLFPWLHFSFALNQTAFDTSPLCCDDFPLSRPGSAVDARERQANLEWQRDRGPPGNMVQPERPGESEGLHLQQNRVHSDRRGAGQPGLHANSRTVPEPDQEAESQFPAVPRGEEVGGSANTLHLCCALTRRCRSSCSQQVVELCLQRREAGVQVLRTAGAGVWQQVHDKVRFHGWRRSRRCRWDETFPRCCSQFCFFLMQKTFCVASELPRFLSLCVCICQYVAVALTCICCILCLTQKPEAVRHAVVAPCGRRICSWRHKQGHS